MHMESKFCNKCNTSYPMTAEYFYRNKVRKSGFSGYCKSCDSEQMKQGRGKRLDLKNTNPKIIKDAIATKGKLETMSYKQGKRYLITNAKTRFKGQMVGETERFIVFKELNHGYLESFMKIDFITGEKKIKEVV